MKQEEWRDVVGYEGYYQVSSLGAVKRLGRADTKVKSDRLIHPVIANNGYLTVRLSVDGCGKNYLVHRLVAEAFIPRVDGKECVDHVDGDRTNNKVENLRWVTYSENNENIIRLGNFKQMRDRNFTKESRVLYEQRNKRPVVRSDGKYYESVRAAARDLGYKTPNAINHVLHGRSKTAKGYTFRYATEDEIMENADVAVLQVDPTTNRIVNVFKSASEAVRHYGNTGIASCLYGRDAMSGGYIWRYGTAQEGLAT